MTIPEVKTEYLINFLTGLLNIPSPTGFTHNAIGYVQDVLNTFTSLDVKIIPKGALVAEYRVEGDKSWRALTAHLDTLGAMVKQIKPNGRLKLTKLGGYAWNTIEGEGCWVFTRRGEAIRGSILFEKASTHVHSDEVNKLRRQDSNMEVRLDARTASVNETLDLGIDVGDFVAFDPRVEVINGFVRARHLDDKAGVACMLAALKSLQAAGISPARTTQFHFSNYEEVGHGAAAGLDARVAELLAIDMAAIGEGQNSDEFHASLCVKDSGGPYHHEFSSRMLALAERHRIPHKVDVYPYYASDGEAYWRAGGDVAVALIGPGVDASHNYERTHLEALLATTHWILAYLTSE